MPLDANSNFMQGLGQTAKSMLLPALAAAAGTGALTGYVSSQDHRTETPGQRRKRILRNALFGGLLGGGATMALPLAYKTINMPLDTAKRSLPARAVSGATDSVFDNVLPAAAGAGGGFAWYKHLNRTGRDADKLISKAIGDNFTNGAQMRSALSDPGRKGAVREMLATALGGEHGRFQANDLLRAGGFPGSSLKEMAGQVPMELGQMGNQYREYLAQRGLLGKLFAKAPLPVAETYGRFALPGASRLVGRVNPLAALGLVGAGMYGANALQNKITGN